MKIELIFLGVTILLLIGGVLAYFPTNKNIILSNVLTHPDQYDRLPDNLTPYCCEGIINGKCNGKVDLETASELIAKGLNPNSTYSPPKKSLKCDKYGQAQTAYGSGVVAPGYVAVKNTDSTGYTVKKVDSQ